MVTRFRLLRVHSNGEDAAEVTAALSQLSGLLTGLHPVQLR